MAKITGSFNIANNTQDTTNYYFLTDGSTGIVGTGALLAPTSNNPVVTFSFSNANSAASLTNSGTIKATANRALYASGLKSGDSITLTNTSTGVILGSYAAKGVSGENNDAFKVKSDFSGGSVTINNSGSIVAGSLTNGVVGLASGATTSGQALDLDDISSSLVTINNYASGLIAAADSDAIRPGADAIINNYGHISGQNASSSSTGNDGIDFQSASHTSGSATINNYASGVIEGARHAITGGFSITVNNSGTIEGHLGSGLNMDTTSGTTVVVNSGLITGNAGGTSDGDGIDVDYLLNLDNSGTISATGTSTGGLSEAVTIGGGVIVNHTAGVITSVQRAITVDDSNGGNAYAATTITNDGLIEGDDGEAIKITDTFTDILTNSGKIIGSVDLGGGGDIINVFVGASFSSTIDGGAGTDVLNLEGTGNGEIGGLANIEIVNVVSGNWTLDSEGFQTVTLAAAAHSLTLTQNVLADGSFSGAIEGIVLNDTVDLQGIGVSTSASLGANNVLTISGGSETITLQLDASQDFSGSTFSVSSDGNGGTILQNVICFYPGVQIATPMGEVSVETLRAGDLVTTVDGGIEPIRWMGRQTVSTLFADPLRVLPVRIRAGALGDQAPSRDLLVSPDHALLIDGVLIHAGALVNGSTITRENNVPEIFTYWHIELANHALVFAEGVAAETFIDNADRMAFDNWEERAAAHEPPPMIELAYPRAKAARQVPQSVRRRLAAAAARNQNSAVA